MAPLNFRLKAAVMLWPALLWSCWREKKNLKVVTLFQDNTSPDFWSRVVPGSCLLGAELLEHHPALGEVSPQQGAGRRGRRGGGFHSASWVFFFWGCRQGFGVKFKSPSSFVRDSLCDRFEYILETIFLFTTGGGESSRPPDLTFSMAQPKQH